MFSRTRFAHTLRKAATRRPLSLNGTVFLSFAGAIAYASQTQKSIHADTSSEDSEEFERQRATMVAPDGREGLALTENNSVHYPRAHTGILRHDYNTVPIIPIGEDDAVFVYCKLPTHSWTIFGIFDGHNGPHTSTFLADNLAHAILGSLADLYSSYIPHPDANDPVPPSYIRPNPPAFLIDSTLKDTFLRLDSEIVGEAATLALKSASRDASKNYLAPAYSGSSALVSFFESDTRLLRVALTGHSHAVLGRKISTQTGKREMYEVHALTSDRHAQEVSEPEAGPTEKVNFRAPAIRHMLGRALKRVFGDGAYKWDVDTRRMLQEKDLCDRDAPSPEVIRLTAEPEITTCKIQPGDFLIMASHGLWNCLTDEEAVGLVGLWLEKNKVTDSPGMYWDEELQIFIDSGFRPSEDLSERTVERDQLPVGLAPDSTVMYKQWKTKKRFINIDTNVAVHLSRNALGGADRDLTAALLNMNHPRAGLSRDDITIHVVFFQ